ncbi:MAG: hypothetical protein HQK70_04740 [Desulfamplus sp.]|nr:hypothetical protein [Desulfamplus sp.]
MLRNEFFQILQESVNLFSWNKEIGIEYLDISEESVRIINGWETKQTFILSQQSSQIEKSLLTQESKLKPLPPANSFKPVQVNASSSLNLQTQSNIHLDSNINCEGDINSQIFFFAEHFFYTDPAGELFTKILKAMNLRSEIVCLCTFPTLDYKAGIPRVRQQVTAIRDQVEQCITDVKLRTNGFYPQIICTLGDSALKIMMGREYLLTASRGRFHNYNGVRLMPTYHPTQIVSDASLKRLVWEDIKQIISIMRLQSPKV